MVEELGSIFTELDEDKASAVAEALPGLQALRRVDFSNSCTVSAKASISKTASDRAQKYGNKIRRCFVCSWLFNAFCVFVDFNCSKMAK